MADPVTDTLAWYDRSAADFAVRTAELDLAPLYDRFLRRVRPGGRILDAGCGVGRDALAFAERGFEVVAFDASEEMARLARERVGGRADGREQAEAAVERVAGQLPASPAGTSGSRVKRLPPGRYRRCPSCVMGGPRRPDQGARAFA